MSQMVRKAAFLNNVARATRARKFHSVRVRRSGYDSEVGKLNVGDIERLAKENGFAIREVYRTPDGKPLPASRVFRYFDLTINQSA